MKCLVLDTPENSDITYDFAYKGDDVKKTSEIYSPPRPVLGGKYLVQRKLELDDVPFGTAFASMVKSPPKKKNKEVKKKKERKISGSNERIRKKKKEKKTNKQTFLISLQEWFKYKVSAPVQISFFDLLKVHPF